MLVTLHHMASSVDLPAPIAESPDVLAAREAHLNYVAPSPPAPVKETPEVAAARLRHEKAMQGDPQHKSN